MQRFQTIRLLIVCGVLALSACTKTETSGNVRSVADYLHDLDAARALLKLAATDPVKYQIDPNALNASAAVAKAMSPSMLQCWPTKPASTATTDHDCLDKKGFKR